MKVAMRIAFGLAAFVFVAGVVYYVASNEWRGTVMLIVLSLSLSYLGLVFRGALRRAAVPATAETMAEEEAAEAEVTPTIWPFVISLAAVLVVLGAVIATWVLIPGVILLAGAGVGWFLDIKHQWHPGEIHAAAVTSGGAGASSLQGEEQPDEADRE
jgi:hypothetical protein